MPSEVTPAAPRARSVHSEPRLPTTWFEDIQPFLIRHFRWIGAVAAGTFGYLHPGSEADAVKTVATTVLFGIGGWGLGMAVGFLSGFVVFIIATVVMVAMGAGMGATKGGVYLGVPGVLFGLLVGATMDGGAGLRGGAIWGGGIGAGIGVVCGAIIGFIDGPPVALRDRFEKFFS